MFTGLIQRVGRLNALRPSGGGMVLSVRHEPWDTALDEGESVSVQGACLTVTHCRVDEFTCDVLEETLRKSNLGRARPGTFLNLERAMLAGDRFGGHVVSGHVDGVGEVSEVKNDGRDWVVEIACGAPILQGVVPQGSIACDGVSLTVSSLKADTFEVSIIPFTWEHTSLSHLSVGATVNLETDMLGKYVRRYLDAGRPPGVSLDSLIKAGFV